MNEQPNPLVTAHAQIADLELMLAMARPIIATAVERALDDRFREISSSLLRRIDHELDGTIHSFTPNGAHR
jgi:hypothetical protein